MNTKALNSLADLICRAQEQDRTPMGIAFAVDAAGRHMSPETAAELESLRAEVAALREERHTTNEALSDAAERMRADRDRIAELEALEPAAIQTCRKCGAGYSYGEPCATCEFRVRMAAETQALQERPLAVWVVEACSPKPVPREVVDGEHYAAVHHPYTTLRDLDFPGTGGAR